MRPFTVALLVFSLLLTIAARPEAGFSNYWHDYRGPGRAGHYDETPILTEWPSAGLPLIWKIDVGVAYSGITVADGRVFTIEQRGQEETVAAYDFESGKESWAVGWKGRYSSFLGGKGPRATPVWDDGRLYAQGALGDLRCLNARNGEEVWSRNILEESGAKNVRWGTSASPLVVDDLLIAVPGAPNGNSVVAYNKLSGERVWSALDDKPSYASPMLATFGGVRQIVVVNASGVAGLTPADGTPLWRYNWKTSHDVNASQPVIVDEDRFLISSGYGHGSALVELSGGPVNFAAKTVWQNKSLKNKFNTSVLNDGFIYGLDEGILVCLEAETGKRVWKGGRYGLGQVLLAGDHLLISAASGDAVLAEATPEGHRELSRFEAVDGKTWNTPAIAGGHLLIRSLKQMACYRIAP